MPQIPDHIKWFHKTGLDLKTLDSKKVEVWEFNHQNDESTLSGWAKHLRNHYCPEDQIDILLKGTGLSRTEYLNQIKFPDHSDPPGPSIRVGDFTEVLVADYLEFIFNYWVPRFRYVNKTIRNESSKGSDTIGFFFSNQGVTSPKDKLAIYESKAQYSGRKTNPILQNAIDDSTKDVIRKAESLNAIKQRYLDLNDMVSVDKVERFQNEIDHPYSEVYGAVAHWDSKLFDPQIVSNTEATRHPFFEKLVLIIIKGDDMMDLVHDLYRRAADEA